MTTTEPGKLSLHESMIWEEGLRLFAITNLSEGNPFRKEIEEQASRSLQEIMRVTSAKRNPTDFGS